jgi:hypothetical protein
LKRWLITTLHDEDLDKLRQDVEAKGGTVSHIPPVPLDRGEQAVEVEGPDDLPDKLKSHPAVLKISPDSDLELY